MKLKPEKPDLIKALIIDDEKDGRELLAGLLNKIRTVKVTGAAGESDQGIEMALMHKPDLLFLDIKMPGKDGFRVIEELKKFNFNPAVIFITAYDQFAIKAIKASALDYLLKPVSIEDLREAIKRYLASLKPKKASTGDVGDAFARNSILKVKTRTGFQLIHLEDLVYIEAEGNYSTIHLNNLKKIVVSKNIGKLLTELPDYILRINRGLAVNLKNIIEIDRKHHTCKVTCEGAEKTFSISREHIKELDSI